MGGGAKHTGASIHSNKSFPIQEKCIRVLLPGSGFMKMGLAFLRKQLCSVHANVPEEQNGTQRVQRVCEKGSPRGEQHPHAERLHSTSTSIRMNTKPTLSGM